jgi:hypothetical protein
MSNLFDRLSGRNTVNRTRAELEAGSASQTSIQPVTKSAVTHRDSPSDRRRRPQADFARSIAATEFAEARYRHRWGGGR